MNKWTRQRFQACFTFCKSILQAPFTPWAWPKASQPFLTPDHLQVNSRNWKDCLPLRPSGPSPPPASQFKSGIESHPVDLHIAHTCPIISNATSVTFIQTITPSGICSNSSLILNLIPFHATVLRNERASFLNLFCASVMTSDFPQLQNQIQTPSSYTLLCSDEYGQMPCAIKKHHHPSHCPGLSIPHLRFFFVLLESHTLISGHSLKCPWLKDLVYNKTGNQELPKVKSCHRSISTSSVPGTYSRSTAWILEREREHTEVMQ